MGSVGERTVAGSMGSGGPCSAATPVLERHRDIASDDLLWGVDICTVPLGSFAAMVSAEKEIVVIEGISLRRAVDGKLDGEGVRPHHSAR